MSNLHPQGHSTIFKSPSSSQNVLLTSSLRRATGRNLGREPDTRGLLLNRMVSRCSSRKPCELGASRKECEEIDLKSEQDVSICSVSEDVKCLYFSVASANVSRMLLQSFLDF